MTRDNSSLFPVEKKVTIVKLFWSVLLSFVIMMNLSTVFAEESLQSMIERTEEGGTLHIPQGTYEGNFVVSKPITITTDEKVVLTSKNNKEPIILVTETKGVSISDVTIKTTGTAIDVKDSVNVKLADINIKGVDSGIKIFRSQQIEIKNNSIVGNDEHYSKKGNGISAYNSRDIRISGNAIESVQDGAYIESVADISIENNKVENSRYGTHFMYSQNAQATNNTYTKNVTGFMVMMTNDVELLNNTITYQDGFNGTGITLYDVQLVNVGNNLIAGNRVAITIQKTTGVSVKSNILQMNQTAIESVKSEQTNLVEKNYFVGNLVNVRSDEIGIHLTNNYYDDYSGIDLNDDGLGEETYVAMQSFGQWMVRKPVYQYYVESPSVVLLNEIDKQTNKGQPTLLVDEEPVVKIDNKQELQISIHYLQLIGGLLVIVGCLIIWRRSVQREA